MFNPKDKLAKSSLKRVYTLANLIVQGYQTSKQFEKVFYFILMVALMHNVTKQKKHKWLR